MAASLLARLERGGVASLVVNYLNVRPAGSWGNETLRIFGTQGFLESTDGGARTRLVLRDEDCGSLAPAEPSRDYLDLYLRHLLGESEMPLTVDEEVHPTRVLIRARAAPRSRGPETPGSFPVHRPGARTPFPADRAVPAVS